MRARTLAGLVLCNLIWSLNPVMSKLILEDFAPPQAALLRYASALIAFAIFTAIAARGASPGASSAGFANPKGPQARSSWLLLATMGLLAFSVSPLLQMTGLQSSRAVDNALIVAMEPLITITVAWLVLRDRVGSSLIIAFVVALAGFALLAGLTPARVAHGFDPRLIGNLWILASLIGEASYSSLARLLLKRHRPIGIFGTSLAIGVLVLTVACLATSTLPSPSSFTLRSALGVLWVGPIGTSLTYLFWMFALTEASVAALALTLFVQPVCGAVWGSWFLGEPLAAAQVLGGVMILSAVLIQNYFAARH